MPSIFSDLDPLRSHRPDRRGNHFRVGSSTPSELRPPTSAPTVASSGRGTMQWPFHSIRASEYSTSHPTTAQTRSSIFRPAAWGFGRPVSSILEADIVPDYVVNFMRGETPESLARKRELRRGAQNPQYESRSRHHRSMTADFYCNGDQQLHDDDKAGIFGNQPDQPLTLKMLTTGWRGGVAINLLLGLLALIVAVVCLVLAARKARMLDGQLELQSGVCAAVNGMAYGVSVAVNILGLIILAGANYAFQVLSSPTRAEIDIAHRQESWVDIGIPSLRNLLFINGIRASLASAIVVLALASQVIYNCLVMVTATDDGCALVLNNVMLIVIVALNVLFVVTIGLAMGRPRLDPIVTLGDAISSFLASPDPTTRGICLLQRQELPGAHARTPKPRTWEPRSHRWMQTASVLRWTMGWLFFWLVCAGLAAAAFAKTLDDDLDDAFKAFGHINSAYTFQTGPPDAAIALVVALPHVVFGVLYLSTNALVTLFFLSHEFSQFAIPGTLLPLRISNGRPSGAQTSSLYLTLPRIYSWVLFFIFVGIGFLVNQSAYLVAVDEDGESVAAIGISPLPLAVLLGLLGLVALFVCVLSLRRTNLSGTIDANGSPAGNPLALHGGANSVIISSRCQRSPLERQDMVTHPVGYGVVRMATNSQTGHAAFSNNPQGVVQAGAAYV
ncbi:hypothetical protein HJFPF1_01869 [Paramyrothecium foliicola]|nr:hypothetical protein HJFPF1_01869 [Paramyrothecium foliicola]